jgi:D-alanyl-D-alanine carboxypeptidase
MVFPASRLFFGAVLALACFAWAPGIAANPLVPTLVVDADTGEVIEANAATRPWHPASTTKLMTAYVALRAVKSGSIRMDTPIVVSALASRQRPSKIGVKPGQEITLENALKFIMVKSANDVAVVIAEGVGGSVEGFAAMMNREARRLGMQESHWTNPHGWEDARQYTSARDLAILARALLREFPEELDLWGIGAVKLGTRVFNNTNGLVGRYSGAMGMKTGFICASGFNLVGAAQRNGRTMIAVVLGASNGADRTLKAAQLLDTGFNGSGGWGRASGRSLDSLTASLETTAPNRRSEICRRGAPPASEAEDFGGAIAQENVDRPSALVALQRAPSESMAVGQRAGNSITLGPRAPFEPLFVHLGRKPGSTEVARRPGVNPGPTQATAFAPSNARAAGQPLALPGAITAPGRPNTPTRATPNRPGAQAAITPANRRQNATTADRRPANAKAKVQPSKVQAEKKKAASPKANAPKAAPKQKNQSVSSEPPRRQANQNAPRT